MITLVQLILYLNSTNTPQINLINHYKKMKLCNNSLETVYKRFEEGKMNVKMSKDNDGINYITVKTSENNTMSFWYCKETIFYDSE